MSRAVLAAPVPLAEPSAGTLADWLAVTRPRIALLILFTVGTGGLFAALPATAPWAILFHAVAGTALVASGASAFNQWLERRTDARMRRTMNRPLPAGRLAPGQVFAFGVALALAGSAWLLATQSTPLPALLAAGTFAAYVAVYTPLKRCTTLNTLVGAVPGAMPPVIGAAAATGTIDGHALALFALLFVWQVPHFLAIAWMYRDQYARAGLVMLPCRDPEGRATARQMVLWCAALVPVSALPVALCGAGWIALLGGIALGGWFLASAVRFARTPSDALARRVLKASLLHLPLLLLLLVIDRLWTLPLF
ncbi:MAG: heme o synthase [Gemmataceae bacterium]|nr:heme o synthase [Gemmataceae bacterium]